MMNEGPVIQFLWSTLVKTSKLKRIIVQYSNNCMSQRKGYKLVKIFEGGWPSVPDNAVLKGGEV
jgi:hypothetical protein